MAHRLHDIDLVVHSGGFPTIRRSMLESFSSFGSSFEAPAGGGYSRTDSLVASRSVDRSRSRDRTFPTMERGDDFEDNLRSVEASTTSAAPQRDSRIAEPRSETSDQGSTQQLPDGERPISTTDSPVPSPSAESTESWVSTFGLSPALFASLLNETAGNGTVDTVTIEATSGTIKGGLSDKPPMIGKTAEINGNRSLRGQTSLLPSQGRTGRKPAAVTTARDGASLAETTTVSTEQPICLVATPMSNGASAVDGTAEIGGAGTSVPEIPKPDLPSRQIELRGPVSPSSSSPGAANRPAAERSTVPDGMSDQQAEAFPVEPDSADGLLLPVAPDRSRAAIVENRAGDAQGPSAPARSVDQDPAPGQLPLTANHPLQADLKAHGDDTRSPGEICRVEREAPLVVDESVFRQAVVPPKEIVSSRLSESSSSELIGEPARSDAGLQNAAAAAMQGASTANDKSTGSVLSDPGRLETSPQGSVAEQILGEVAGRIEATHRDGKIDFRMRLDPPGLGTVHVQLIATDRSVSAQLIASDESARQALEGQWHNLRDSLARLGVTLQHSTVGRDGRSGSGGNWQGPHRESPAAPQSEGSLRLARPTSERVLRPASGGIDVVV